jgi:hypothetical protein
MNFGLGLRQGLGLTAAAAALLSICAVLSATPARAFEDTSSFNSMLGYFGMQVDKDEDSIDYHARPPLVVPPRFDLPPPKEAKRDPAWPKDPDAAAERRAALGSRRPAPKTTSNTQAGTPQAELQQHNDSPPVNVSADGCEAQAGSAICLFPPFSTLKNFVTGFHSDNAQPGPEPPRKFLTEPPPGYRQGVAKASADAPKDKPDSANTGADVHSQGHKTTADN